MAFHDVKIWPKWFDAVRDGKLNFNVRRNDRDYKVGDTLVMQEFNPGTGVYSDRKIEKKITYVETGDADRHGMPGIQHGYAVLGLADHMPGE